MEDAECHNEGQIEGTLRNLNLSYNSFTAGLNLPNKQKPIALQKDGIIIDDDAEEAKKKKPT